MKWKAGMGLMIGLCLLAQYLQAQPQASVTLEQCYAWVEDSFPIARQWELIERSKPLQERSARTARLPQLQLQGQATYQSDVTSLPVELPGLDIPTLDQDQYKLYVDIFQPLTNGSQVLNRQQQVLTATAIEQQEVEIQLHQVKQQVLQAYFGVLVLDARLEQLALLGADLESALTRMSAAVGEGTAMVSDLRLLEAEQLQLEQQEVELNAQRQTMLTILSSLTGQSLSATTELEMPAPISTPEALSRAEMQVFTLRDQTLDLQDRAIDQRLIPQLGLFLQAGYGRPALNFLSNEFDTYYLGGFRLQWNIASLYSSKHERELLVLARQKNDQAREAFLLQYDLQQQQQDLAEAQYRELQSADAALIRIREEVRRTAEVQLSNGTLTALDYLSYLHAENRARQQQVLHRSQMLMAQYQRQLNSGSSSGSFRSK